MRSSHVSFGASDHPFRDRSVKVNSPFYFSKLTVGKRRQHTISRREVTLIQSENKPIRDYTSSCRRIIPESLFHYSMQRPSISSFVQVDLETRQRRKDDFEGVIPEGV